MTVVTDQYADPTRPSADRLGLEHRHQERRDGDDDDERDGQRAEEVEVEPGLDPVHVERDPPDDRNLVERAERRTQKPRHAGAPVWPAHAPGVLLKLHRRHEPGLGEARTSASALLVMAEHSGTHIDAFCHQAENLELHGGVAVNAQVQTPEGFTRLGADTIAPLLAWRAQRASDPDTARGLVVGLGPLDSVVLAMHDVEMAGPVLASTLDGRAGYVAALGSRAMQQARETWLTDRGVPGIERIHTPAGLDIGADGPGEVAVAILAEAILVRSGRAQAKA